MKPTIDDTTLARILRRSLALIAVLLLIGVLGMLIACTRDLPDGDQTVAPDPTSVPTAALKPTVAPRPTAMLQLVQSDKSRGRYAGRVLTCTDSRAQANRSPSTDKHAGVGPIRQEPGRVAGRDIICTDSRAQANRIPSTDKHAGVGAIRQRPG